MGDGQHWRTLFENWPGSVPRAGILVVGGENIPFKEFLIGDGVLLVERERPDPSGARKLMIGFDVIQQVKTTDTLELVRYQAFGFAPAS